MPDYFDRKGIRHLLEWSRDQANAAYLQEERSAWADLHQQAQLIRRHLEEDKAERNKHAEEERNNRQYKKDILYLEKEADAGKVDYAVRRACSEYMRQHASQDERFSSSLGAHLDLSSDKESAKKFIVTAFHPIIQARLCAELSRAAVEFKQNESSRLSHLQSSLQAASARHKAKKAELETAQAAYVKTMPARFFGIPLGKRKSDHLERQQQVERVQSELDKAAEALKESGRLLRVASNPETIRGELLSQLQFESFFVQNEPSKEAFRHWFLRKVLDPYQSELPPRCRVGDAACFERIDSIYDACIALFRKPDTWWEHDSDIILVDIIDDVTVVPRGCPPYAISGGGDEFVFLVASRDNDPNSILNAIQELRPEIGPEGAKRILESGLFAWRVSTEAAASFRRRLEDAGALLFSSPTEFQDWKVREAQHQARLEELKEINEDLSKMLGNEPLSNSDNTNDSDNDHEILGSVTVAIVDVHPSKTMAVIQALKEINKDLSLAEAKDMVENCPANVLESASPEQARRAKELLESAGAEVELEPE